MREKPSTVVPVVQDQPELHERLQGQAALHRETRPHKKTKNKNTNTKWKKNEDGEEEKIKKKEIQSKAER